MAYDLVKQTHPGAPCAVGARVIDGATGQAGTIAPPLPGQSGVRVRFDGRFGPVDCDPARLTYAAPPPAPTPPWCLR